MYYLENYTLNVLNALYNFSILLGIIYARPSENIILIVVTIT